MFPAASQAQGDTQDFVELLQQVIVRGRAPEFNVPAAPTPYFGYQAQLSAAVAALRAPPSSLSGAVCPVLVVSGPSGCGATSFLHHLAAQVRAIACYLGGIYFADIRGTKDSDSGLSAVCRCAGVPVSSSPLDTLKQWCRSRRNPTLLIVDAGETHSAGDGRPAALRWLSSLQTVSSTMVTFVLAETGASSPLPDAAITLSGLSSVEAQALVNAMAPHLALHCVDIARQARLLSRCLCHTPRRGLNHTATNKSMH